MNTTAYPLCWPMGWPRHPGARANPAGASKCGFVFARKKIAEEIRRIRADDEVLSTNCRLLLSGEPRGDERPHDPGAAIYFSLKGKSMVMATDYFNDTGSNVWRLAMAMNYLRGLERHGGGTMLARAFAGFAALPEPGRHSPWREVMGFAPGEIEALHPDLRAGAVEQRYKRAAMERHPDKGGTTEQMADLNRAREEAAAEIMASA